MQPHNCLAGDGLGLKALHVSSGATGGVGHTEERGFAVGHPKMLGKENLQTMATATRCLSERLPRALDLESVLTIADGARGLAAAAARTVFRGPTRC